MVILFENNKDYLYASMLVPYAFIIFTVFINLLQVSGHFPKK